MERILLLSLALSTLFSLGKDENTDNLNTLIAFAFLIVDTKDFQKDITASNALDREYKSY
ncbi:hypothetical protein FGF1_43060 [Flavobacteriaceae bacterium GF1]